MNRQRTRWILWGGLLVFFSCQRIESPESGGATMAKLQVQSAAFKEGELIPQKYTCDGNDVSPPLAWSGAPEKTRAFALISDDPDAPMGTWVHWVLYNIPAKVIHLAENVPAKSTLDNGACHGTNDFRKLGYGGPCPPSGTHRYFFKVYALDAMLDMPPGATKAKLEMAMRSHVLAEGQLVGIYKRQ